jgi:hypothetical protein
MGQAEHHPCWSVWLEEVYAAETGNAQLKSLNPAGGPSFRKGR